MSKTTVKKGSNVTLHYHGTLTDGSVFDSSRDRGEPMEVTVGDGGLIKGFDNALQGMTEGETKTFTIPSDEAYGPRDPDAFTILDRTVFPPDFEFETNMKVPLDGPGGRTYIATLVEFDDKSVTADLNHPMAGQDLTFEVEVLNVETETTAS